MTDFYRTEIYDKQHIHFGGIIYQSDFETDHRGKDNNNGSSIAQRIVSDLKRDEQWRKNIENRERNKIELSQIVGL